MGLTGKGTAFIAAFVTRKFPDTPQIGEAAEGKDDLSAVCKSVVAAAGPSASKALLGESDEVRAQVEEWLTFAVKIHADDKVKATYLRTLDAYLASKSVFVGSGTSISVADVALFVSIHDQVAALPKEELKTYPNLLRWIDYVQHKDDQSKVYEWIPVDLPKFNPPMPSSEPEVKKVAAAAAAPASSEKEKSSPATSAASGAPADNKSAKKESKGKPEATVATNVEKKADVKDVQPKEKKAADQSREKKEATPVQKDAFGFEILDIRVGIIESVKKHPTADTLYVEDINIGEGNVRQVVSGLAKYLTEEQMLKRRVLVLANVKPSKLRDVMSAGLVLCASNEDHTQCEPVLPPQGAAVGERVIVAGFEGKPEPVLNPKKKQWDKLYPDLHTDDTGVACYQGKPLMTTAGPCSSSITKGSINELFETGSTRDLPEDILELHSPDRIPSATSQPDPVTSRPVLRRFFEPIPSRVEAGNSDNKLGFTKIVDCFPHKDIDPVTVVEETEAFVVPPYEPDSELNLIPPTFGRPGCGNGSFFSASQQIIQQELISRHGYGTNSMQDEILRVGNPLAFVSGFGVSFRDSLRSFHIEEVPIEISPCALGSAELEPATVFSIAPCLSWRHAAAPLPCGFSLLRPEDSCYTSSSGTVQSWDLSPLSEVLDAGCEDFFDEQLEWSPHQEVTEPEDVVVSFDIPRNGSALLADGTWSPEALSGISPCLSTPRLLAPEQIDLLQVKPGTADSDTGSGNYIPSQLDHTSRSQLQEVMDAEPAVSSLGPPAGRPSSGPLNGCWLGGLTARTRPRRDRAVSISSPRDLPSIRRSFSSLQGCHGTTDCETKEQYGHVLPTMWRFAGQYPPRASRLSPEETRDYASSSYDETDSVTEHESERTDRVLSPSSVGSEMLEFASLNSSADELELEYGRVDTIFSPKSPGSEALTLEMERAYSTFSPLSLRSGATGLASANSDFCEPYSSYNVAALN